MTLPAYVPQIGALLQQGENYDMAVSEEVTHSNEVTRYPIEDPTRSFIYDHNREEPVEMRLSLRVSTAPLSAGTSFGLTSGVDRLTQFQEQILAMRAAQSVGTSAYIDVYTGLRVYRNMGIESLTFKRDPETPNVLDVDIALIEFRFARAPRAENQIYSMDANDGPRNSANAILADEIDRPIVEATKVRYAPKLSAATKQTRSIIGRSIERLAPVIKQGLGIIEDAKDLVEDTLDELNLFVLDNVPSQVFSMNFGGVSHDLRFDFNQAADRWSFTAALSSADCPLIGGRFVEPGFNLFLGINTDQMLLPLDRPGISTTGLGWRARLTVRLSDGVPATMLALGSRNAFNSLFRRRATLSC